MNITEFRTAGCACLARAVRRLILRLPISPHLPGILRNAERVLLRDHSCSRGKGNTLAHAWESLSASRLSARMYRGLGRCAGLHRPLSLRY
jgi:hypothetical protein